LDPLHVPELLVLALASACWPTLVAVDVVALRSPRPVPLLGAFLAGGLLTTVVIGVAIVSLLGQTSFVRGPEPLANPMVDIVVGAVSLALARVLWRRPRATKPRRNDGEPSRWERMLERGAPLAFAAGIVLNVIPGVVPFVAMKDIAERDYGPAGTFAVVLAFYVVMFVLVEAPLVSYLIRPDWTSRTVGTFNAWLDRNGRRLSVGALALVGVYLVARGIVAAYR
jgi:hypothetical protein